ncbi:LysR substrate-binding domain-containing protein [Streptomyces sp. 1222.5]|uniref:LysR substrate-binding domain-containing protein n=1 Tax=Streptomyces sp. 1222.5 TaxID=1881026 RepID=UPI003D7283FE
MEKEVGGCLVERLPRGVRLTAPGAPCCRRPARAWPPRTAPLPPPGGPPASSRASSRSQPSIRSAAASCPKHWGWPGRHRHRSTPAQLGGDRATPGRRGVFLVTHPADPRTSPAGGVPLIDLADREWIHYTPDSGLADFLDGACARAGFQPRVAVRTQQATFAANFAAAGLGIALVPGNVLAPEFRGRLLRPEPPLLRTLAAYTRGEPDPITHTFLDLLTAEIPLAPAHIRDRFPC